MGGWGECRGEATVFFHLKKKSRWNGSLQGHQKKASALYKVCVAALNVGTGHCRVRRRAINCLTRGCLRKSQPDKSAATPDEAEIGWKLANMNSTSISISSLFFLLLFYSPPLREEQIIVLASPAESEIWSELRLCSALWLAPAADSPPPPAFLFSFRESAIAFCHGARRR